MLEEALRDEKGRNPSETALAMLNFLQYDLAPGGAAADARLCNSLFGPLCERIFGPMDEHTYSHAPGVGWLAAQARWARPPAPTSTSSASASASSTHQHRPNGTGAPRSTAPPSSSTSGGGGVSSSSSSSSSSHWEADPVVRLLATANRPQGASSNAVPSSSSSLSSSRKEPALPTLIEAISGQSENRPNAGFAFPFLALPKVIQDAYMEVLDESLLAGSGIHGAQSAFGTGTGTSGVGQGFAGRRPPQASSAAVLPLTDNDLRLFGGVLNRSPREQPGLLRWRHVRAQLREAASQQAHAHAHAPPQFRTSSPMNLYQGGFPSTSFRGASATPNASVLSPGGPFQFGGGFGGGGGGFGGGGGGGGPARETQREETKPPPVTVILSMLEYYLLLFIRFPTAVSAAASTAATNPGRFTANTSSVQPIYTPFGEMVYVYLFARYLGYFLPYVAESGRCIALDGTSYVQSELFLRLCVALWLEAPLRPAPTSAAIAFLAGQQQPQRLRRGTGDPSQKDPTSSAAESGNFQQSLDRSFDLVQTQQPFSPPSSHVKACLRKLIVHVLSDPSLRNGIMKQSSSSSSTGGAADGAGATFVHHAIWILQAPLYNYVRVAFRNASIHTNNSAFFSALDLWLLYLEPWNLSRPKSINALKDAARHQPSRFVLTVPRYSDASKYEPSWEPYVAANLHMYLTPLAIFLRRSRELDFSARKFEFSLKIVKRVLRVFTPALLRALDDSPLRYPSLLEQHVGRLGKFAPPLAADPSTKSSSLLISCQADMQSLLEEVHMQHLKKVRDLDVFDRLGAWFEGIFGMGVIQGEEKELDGLVAQAKGIVGFPSTYHVFPRGLPAAAAERGTTAASDRAFPMRTSDGQLTKQGRELIVKGEAKCNPADVSFVGDKMYGSVRPHEVGWLVVVLVYLSDALNGKFGWNASTMVRINLRFLADYRNLLATLLALYILSKLYI